MADARHRTDALPPVPGFWRLGWLLFMQPLTLHRLFAVWGLENDPPLWRLWGRLREGDPVVRALVTRLNVWLLVMPSSIVTIVYILDLADVPVDWAGFTLAIVLGVALSVGGGYARGVIVSVALGSSFGVAMSIAGGIARGVAVGIAVSAAVGIARGIANGGVRGVAVGIFVGGALGGALGIYFGGATGLAIVVILPLALRRLISFPLELALTAALCLIVRLRPASLPHLASYLPYRHHELIYLPLPFLAGFLVRLGEADEIEGRRALIEAATSTGQKGPARRALVELQARSLERAAREKQYASAAALTLPFLPGRESFRSSQPRYLSRAYSVAAAAQDLEAARSTGSHHQRRQALIRARKELERTLDDLTATRRLPRDERRFLPVVKGWLDRVEDEETALAELERERSQVPLVFVAGVPLTPADESLFKGRRDLVRLLDQDLAAERPVPLVLLGQRRMGKSTLLNFLPRLLGTGTRVVRLDFQGLSGHPLRGTPHGWVAAEVAAALVGEGIKAAASPSEEAPWSATLDWLASLEEPLATVGRRLLIALDEIEGLERGIREDWSDPAFLDFLRAAGDRLHRSRFLLVTAHPFYRLGPHWSDRLISAQTRRIEPLGQEDARKLLTKPVDGFPAIYPKGGVEHLLTMTGCHPYLLQLTAYHLTRRLNDAGRLKATNDDLTAALDQALEENNLFQYLWDDLTSTQQRLVAALARGKKLPEAAAGEAAEILSQARRDLAREQLICQIGEGKKGWRVTVPLFARWIHEIGATE
jgi:uncharacterized protein